MNTKIDFKRRGLIIFSEWNQKKKIRETPYQLCSSLSTAKGRISYWRWPQNLHFDLGSTLSSRATNDLLMTGVVAIQAEKTVLLITKTLRRWSLFILSIIHCINPITSLISHWLPFSSATIQFFSLTSRSPGWIKFIQPNCFTSRWHQPAFTLPTSLAFTVP